MDIREALAAQGSAPLVFMGGTCAGPTWRERLCAQVKKEFRWFNPVVSEWTEAAKETELAVREEADIMLYVITPYQEGCYGYLELTEDTIRSGKPCVVCFLPSFEDKAFNEKQWSSIISARGLLERNGGKVLLSMEELIDWFNTYNPSASGSKMIDTAELVRAAETAKPTNVTEPPVAATTLLQKSQAERVVEYSEPAQAEPGTVTATSMLGTVSTEGFMDSLRSFFGLNKNDEPASKDKDRVSNPHPRIGLNKIKTGLLDTLGNVDWMTEHWSDTLAHQLDWRCLLIGNSISKNPATGVSGAIRSTVTEVAKMEKSYSKYDKDLMSAEKNIQDRWNSGELKPEDLDEEIHKKFSAIKVPLADGSKGVAPMGGATYTVSFKDGLQKTEANEPPRSDVTPKIVADYVKAIVNNLDALQKLYDVNDDFVWVGIDATEGFWRSEAVRDLGWAQANIHHLDGDTPAVYATEFRIRLSNAVISNCVRVLNNADAATNRATVGLEAFSEPASYDICDLVDGAELDVELRTLETALNKEEVAGYKNLGARVEATPQERSYRYYGAIASDGQLIGMVNYNATSDELAVSGLYVRPAFRRMGVATMLLRTVLEELGNGRMAFLRARVDQPAVALYEQLGFKVTSVTMLNTRYIDEGEFVEIETDKNDKSINEYNWAKTQKEPIQKTFATQASTESLAVSQEGLLSWLGKLFGSSGDSAGVAKPNTRPRMELGKVSKQIDATLGNDAWLTEHWDTAAVAKLDWSCLLIDNKLSNNPESDLGRVLTQAKAYTRQSSTALGRYAKEIYSASHHIETLWENEELDDDELSDEIVKKIGAVKTSAKNGDKRDSWVGGGTATLVEGKRGTGTLTEKIAGSVPAADVTPATVAAYVRGVINIAAGFLSIMDEWDHEWPFDCYGLDLGESYWRKANLTNAAYIAGNPHYMDGGLSSASTDLFQFPVQKTASALVQILNNADVATGTTISVDS